MKKIILTLLTVFYLSSSFATNPVKEWGQLQVKGTQLCDAKGNPVVLRGVSLGWHNCVPFTCNFPPSFTGFVAKDEER